ncbi:hypothetical protein H0H81_004738 [Sphagnurus paluster]|uniref:Glutathione synthetase n=1 Tax=Sphagnurus paluster TaxID=117069 RepID=A0A9P7GQT4_9AGAR|nr:hypothetical protein H0H81_004738 [Sphagnurus paluster]
MALESILSQWPPKLSDIQINELTLLATSYAFANGLLYLPPAERQPSIPESAIHAPLALFPSPFPRNLFEQAKRLQHIYNVLYARIAQDEEFLDRIMGTENGVGKVDEFIGQLWTGWKQLRDEGLVQVVHTFRCSAWRAQCVRSATPRVQITRKVRLGSVLPFILQALLITLESSYGIHAIRQTFDELSKSATVDPTTRVLRISCSPDIHPEGFVEISTVYFRAGYAPTEYLTPQHYQTRFLLERSKAINCPSIALQLAGGKKIQQVLTQPGVLESFLSDGQRWGTGVYDAQALDELRSSFMGMWSLDVGADLLTPDHDALTSGKEGFGVSKARELAHSLVLKPQREGGGNNVYKESIPPFLDSLPPEERQAWIAMELIVPPNGTGNYLVRAGGASQTPFRVDVVSELGIFGWALFGDKDGGVREKEAGWLVRTKGKDSDEGGVATGFSVLDSVLLVDE